MAFKNKTNMYLVMCLFNITNTMLFTTYFLYLTNELHLSYTMAVLLDLPTFIMQFIFELPSGFFADKFGLKKSVLIGILALSLAPLVYCLTTNYTLLFFTSILYGIGYAFISGALEALSIEIFEDNLKRFFTLKQLIQNGVGIIIPVITIALSQIVGLRIFYLFDLMLKLGIIIVLIVGIRELKKDYVVQKYGLEFIVYGFKSIRKQLLNSRAISHQSIAQLLWGFTSTAVDIFWIKLIDLSTGQSNVGMVFALASIVAILANVFAYKIKRVNRFYWVTFLIHSLFVIFAGVFINSTIAIICILGRSFFINVYEVLSQIVVNKIIIKDRATMLSFFSFLSGIGKIVAIIVIGIIADKFGVGVVWIVSGLILLLVTTQIYLTQKFK